MKLIIYFFNIAPLYICVQKQNVEMVKLLLTSEKIDVNIKSIQKKIKFFNRIRHQFFQFNLFNKFNEV